MVNKENINKLVAFLEAESLPWNMGISRNCFFGQAEKCFGKGEPLYKSLGIDDTEGGTKMIYALTIPTDYQKGAEFYPRERAIAQLKYVRDNGVVDWNATPVTSVSEDPTATLPDEGKVDWGDPEYDDKQKPTTY